MKLASLAVLPAAAVLLGCPSSSSSSLTFTPITGVAIDSAQLVAGIGCGTAPGQVFKYAALLSFSPLAPDGNVDTAPDAGPLEILTSGVFECFANGIFSNLPPSEAGTSAYTIQVFAFDQASFPPELECVPSPTGTGSLCPGDDAGAVIRFEGLASWTATCTATQVPGATQVAACTPLVPVAAPQDGGATDAADASDATQAADATDAATDGG